MIHRRKYLLSALTPILAGFVMVGSTLASPTKRHSGSTTARATDAAASTGKTTSKKKRQKASKTASETAPTDTAISTRKSRKAAKRAAVQSKREAAKSPAQAEGKKSAPVEAKTAAREAKPEPASATQHAAAPGRTAAKVAPTNASVSSGDIASAKAKGLVWVNTDSKVYHKDGRYYGRTKQGKFMTEADAQRAGYKAAKK